MIRPATVRCWAFCVAVPVAALGCSAGADESVASSPPSVVSTIEAAPAETVAAPMATTPVVTEPATVVTDGPTTTGAAAMDCAGVTSGAHSIDIDGVTRTFDLYVPDDLGSAGAAAPLMVLFHGFSGSAADIAVKTSLATMAPAAGVALAVPQGVDSPPTWHYVGDTFGDSLFVDALLDELTGSACIDPQAVWLAGFSAGSAFTGVYGCSHADRIAGLVMVSGLAPPICPADDSPVIQITHGVADPVVLFDGGLQGSGDEAVQLDPVPVSAAGWAASAGCAPEPTVMTFGDIVNTVTSWSGCGRGPTVSLVAIDGLGHAWPGAADAPPGQAVDGPVVDPGCVALHTMTGETGTAGASFAACFDLPAADPSGPGAVPGDGPGGEPTTEPFEVGTVAASFIDVSRPTIATATSPELPQRTIATTIVHPLAPGPFPLIVLSHGLTGLPEKLTQLATTWASAGYVVALPAFPLTNGSVPNAVANLGDVANQPGDVSFVIDSVLMLNRDDTSLLFGRVDGGRIGIAGHSLGGATTYGVAFNECCRDERIDAVVILAGFVFVEPERNNFALDLPVLIVHGDADPVLDIAHDADVYEQLAGPKWFVTLVGGTHSPPFENETSAYDGVVEHVTTDFWNGYLGGEISALDVLRADAAVGGVSILQTDNLMATGE